jgi:hypothetical protein
VSDSGPLFGRNPDAVNFPPFETEDLRENLARFLIRLSNGVADRQCLSGTSVGAPMLSSTTTVNRSTWGKVQGGLRRVLLTQAKRLQWLAARRYDALGGAASVAREGEGDDEA